MGRARGPGALAAPRLALERHAAHRARGREAAWLWAGALRAFATCFGVRRFVVNPVQIGEDNADAIASGAFWFYWRLGFRPVGARIAADVAALLGAPGRRAWSPAEIRAFERLAPVVALVAPQVARWAPSRKRALLAMMQAKGAPQERTYVRAMQRVPGFWQALAAWGRAHPPG